MTSNIQNFLMKNMEKPFAQSGSEHQSRFQKGALMKFKDLIRSLFLLLSIVALMSCGSNQNIEEQAQEFIKAIQNLDIDKCVESSYPFQTKLAAIQNEPQFKKDKLIADISNEIRRTILNQYDNDNIIYIFNFPCKWQILETKKLSQETTSGMLSSSTEYYRVFVEVKYNSIDNSPVSVPLINKDNRGKYNIREIILHCDFDPDTKLYLGWGLDSHTKW